MAPQRGAPGGGGERRPLPAEPAGSSGSTQGLPRAFLQSLRTLFDILDEDRRGYVHLREIESRWRQQPPPPGGEGRESPRSVLEGLRRAAPASGYLTFERFVLGLRASLLSPEKKSPAGGAPPGPPSRSRRDAEAPLAERAPGRGCAPARSLEKIPHLLAEQVPACKRAGADAGGRKPAGRLQNEGTSKAGAEGRRPPRGRGEHRRHTITNGVDYCLLKQMKELEKEKDFLFQGLEMVERAREWYHQQILLLQERQKQLGKSKVHSDLLAEGAPSQLGCLLPKLQELNRCLCELLSLSAKPLSPCSADPGGQACGAVSSPPLAGAQQTIQMLKDQNRLLTKEVTDKSERITQLEQEKSALIKQLFEARAHGSHETNLLDSTFI
ncbi:suppressor APC domain-containing protein 2 [Hemicordylus capensis]|uniref:suppressor APC domain-containing protein 2 n=1 Tax=Hemicordylus capensis TaxID=884348 RepID=UPI002302820C|nr:suppressor APC domain-containing protein 2 [Hemicordylus capensis]